MNTTTWRKSSYSGTNNDCVELAYEGQVRDSKNPQGPRLGFNRARLTSFLAAVKADKVG